MFSFFRWIRKSEINSYSDLVPLSKEMNKQKKTVSRIFLIDSLAFMFFTPWLAFMISEGVASSTQPQIPPPTSFNIFQTFITFIFGFQSSNIQAVFISLWPLFV